MCSERHHARFDHCLCLPSLQVEVRYRGYDSEDPLDLGEPRRGGSRGRRGVG